MPRAMVVMRRLKGLKFFLNIVNSGIPLYIGIKRKNELLGMFLLNAIDQCFNIELIGANTIQWGNNAAKHMIGAVKLLGALNGDDIPDGFHDANGFLFTH